LKRFNRILPARKLSREHLQELIDSIRKKGFSSPDRPAQGNGFELIAGKEDAGSPEAGMKEVPSWLKRSGYRDAGAFSDREYQREDLNPSKRRSL